MPGLLPLHKAGQPAKGQGTGAAGFLLRLWHGACRETASLSLMQHPGGVKGSGQNSQSLEARRGQERELGGKASPESTYFELTTGRVCGLQEEDLPRARTNVLCKSWGDPQEPPPLQDTGNPEGPPAGGTLGGLLLEGNVSSRARASGKLCFLLTHIRIYKSCNHLAAGQDRHTPGIQGKEQYH